MKAEANIYNSLKFIYFILKILGLAPYTFDKTSRKLIMNAKASFLMILSITFWIGLSWFNLQRFWTKKYSIGIQSKLLDNLLHHQYLLQFFFACLIVVFSVLKRKHIENFLDSLFSFDERLRSFKWNFKAPSYQIYTVALFIFTAVLITSYLTMTTLLSTNIRNVETGTFKIIGSILSYTAITEFMLMISVQFILSAYLVRSRLRALGMNFR